MDEDDSASALAEEHDRVTSSAQEELRQVVALISEHIQTPMSSSSTPPEAVGDCSRPAPASETRPVPAAETHSSTSHLSVDEAKNFLQSVLQELSQFSGKSCPSFSGFSEDCRPFLAGKLQKLLSRGEEEGHDFSEDEGRCSAAGVLTKPPTSTRTTRLQTTADTFRAGALSSPHVLCGEQGSDRPPPDARGRMTTLVRDGPPRASSSSSLQSLQSSQSARLNNTVLWGTREPRQQQQQSYESRPHSITPPRRRAT